MSSRFQPILKMNVMIGFFFQLGVLSTLLKVADVLMNINLICCLILDFALTGFDSK